MKCFKISYLNFLIYYLEVIERSKQISDGAYRIKFFISKVFSILI